MKLFDFFKKNDLDEMQEQKLLKIEHNGFWLAYFGLFAALMAQMFLCADVRIYAGEFVLLLALSVYIVCAELKAGIWSRRVRANAKTNLRMALAGGVVVFLFVSGAVFYRYGYPLGAAVAGAFGGILAFALTFLMLQIALREYQKQHEKLEGEGDE